MNEKPQRGKRKARDIPFHRSPLINFFNTGVIFLRFDQLRYAVGYGLIPGISN